MPETDPVGGGWEGDAEAQTNATSREEHTLPSNVQRSNGQRGLFSFFSCFFFLCIFKSISGGIFLLVV